MAIDPYERLGVNRFDSIEDIESIYRGLLRESHPDLHQGGSREEIARAEQMTVELNAAMARIRSSHRDRSPGFVDPPTFDDAEGFDPGSWGFRTGPDTDWFGNPVGPRRNRAEHVDCPLCSERFTDPDTYRSHLVYEHQREDVSPRTDDDQEGRRRPSLHWMGWIPAPAFWFLVVLVAYWAAVYAVLGEGLLAFAAVWVGVVVYAVLLRLAYKHRRRAIWE